MIRGDIVLVDKPAGWTSFDVVAKIRGAIRAGYVRRDIQPTKRQLKVGHTGTLDPFATGLLVILLGDACARSHEFLKLDKMYDAVIELGKSSTTGDPEGIITEHTVSPPSLEHVRTVLTQFTGVITQTPPAFSAIKIDGKRAYQLARAGKDIDIPSRQVQIYSLDVVEYTYPVLHVRVHVSSGTYIRTLAEDIGQALGTGAYCRELRRMTVGEFRLADARTVEQVLADIELDNHQEQDDDEKHSDK